MQADGINKGEGASCGAEAGLAEVSLMSALLHLEAHQNMCGFEFWRSMKGFSPFLL